MEDWDPAQYLVYEDYRLRPGIDLITRLGGSPREIWDLGCGTGTITGILAERWPGAAVHGLDSSPAMLERARALSGIDWVLGDINAWRPSHPVDLVFSNAALHWIDDHQTLLPRLIETLGPQGVLAVQMPRNHGAPSHTMLAKTARSPRWVERVGHLIRPTPVAPPRAYHSLLSPLVATLDVWETEYLQVLHGPNPVAAWTRSTAAKPFIEALGDDAEAFMDDYGGRLRNAYPPSPDGTTLFPFKRLFIVGRK